MKRKFNSELIYGKNIQKLKKTNAKEDFQCLYAPVTLIDSIGRKDENCYPEVLWEKYNFIEDIDIYSSNSDQEHYDEECINLFLDTLTK